MAAETARLEHFKGTVVAPTDLLALQPGRVTGLIGHPGFGLTRLGLTMLASPGATGNRRLSGCARLAQPACRVGSRGISGTAGSGPLRRPGELGTGCVPSARRCRCRLCRGAGTHQTRPSAQVGGVGTQPEDTTGVTAAPGRSPWRHGPSPARGPAGDLGGSRPWSRTAHPSPIGLRGVGKGNAGNDKAHRGGG